jgi:hypothetical protein
LESDQGSPQIIQKKGKDEGIRILLRIETLTLTGRRDGDLPRLPSHQHHRRRAEHIPPPRGNGHCGTGSLVHGQRHGSIEAPVQSPRRQHALPRASARAGEGLGAGAMFFFSGGKMATARSFLTVQRHAAEREWGEEEERMTTRVWGQADRGGF